jgi:RNase P/RNase MRP subunit p30
MKAYADLHLAPSLDDVANARSMATLLAELHTALIGLVLPPQRLTPTPPIVEAFKSAGIDVAKRLNLKPRSREELLRNLRRFRSRYEIVAVDCGIVPVSRVAVRDRRVDIVYFPKHEHGTVFRGNLARNCRAALEFDISELTSRLGFEGRLHRVKREIEIAAELSATVIGCTGASNSFELRSLRDIAAVLHLFGLPLTSAMRSVSEVPFDMVTRNRLRMGKTQLEDGVKLLRRPADRE